MPFKFAQIFAVSCLILLFNVPSAYAVEINDAGAKNLKKTLSAHLESYKKSFQNTGGTLKTDGDITIEQGDGYYAATLPAATFETATGENIKFGLIAVNAIPTDNSDNWKISMAIPTPILITDKDDTILQRIDIGAQNMGGLWSTKLENFAKLKAQYDDIKFTDIKSGSFFNIRKVFLNSDLEEKKDGLWSGPTNFTLSEFSVGKPDTKQNLTLKEMSATVNIGNYAHDKFKKTQEKLKTTSKRDTGNYLLDILTATGDASAQFTLKGLNINSQKERDNVQSIDLIQFGFSSKIPNNNTVDQSLGFGYSGLKLKDSAKNTALIPAQLKTSLSLEKLPFLEVSKFAEEAIGNNKDSSAKQVAATKALNFLPQKLKEAGTILSLKNTSFGNSLYNINIDGDLKAESSAKMGGIGSFNIETTGLDTIMKELQTMPNGQKIAQQLTLFRMVSDEKDNKNIAHIKLDKAGNITINDKDISALMDGNDPAKQDAPAGAPE